ncbi:DSD1 family PLP-dependent enzyme [Inquilinus sp. 2KB_12]
MAGLAAQAGVKLRPHAKTHKSPVSAHLQLARGAVGQCTQKVAEAEVLAWGGVPDILVSNKVVSPRKLARLGALTRIARIAVLVVIDVGTGRCGVAPGEAAVALARRIAASRHLAFGGLQAYHGRAQHRRSPEERAAAIAEAAQAAGRTVEGLRRAGLDCPIVGGAGTGTFALEAVSGVFTELQVGSYAFMDADYARNDPPPPFRHALFVLAAVMSVPRDGAAVVDAGHKALPTDSGMRLVWGRDGIRYEGPSDEHGRLVLEPGAARPKLGERLRLVPGHCDPTVDRYGWYVGIRNGRAECLWPVAARGTMA